MVVLFFLNPITTIRAHVILCDGIHDFVLLINVQERGQLRLRVHQLDDYGGSQGALLLPAKLLLESARLQEGDQHRPGHAAGVCVMRV